MESIEFDKVDIRDEISRLNCIYYTILSLISDTGSDLNEVQKFGIHLINKLISERATILIENVDKIMEKTHKNSP